MFWHLLLAAQWKLFKRPLFWIELAVFAGIILFMNVVMYAVLPSLPDANIQIQDWSQGLVDTLRLASMSLLSGMVVVVLAGSIVASDYQWRVLHLWVSHGAPRGTLFAARWTALLVPIILIPLSALLVGAPVSAFLIARLGGEVDLVQISLLQLGLSLLRTGYTLLPYLALAVLLAVASRAPVAPVGGGAAFILAESVLIQLLGSLGGGLGSLAYYLPAGLSLALTSLNRATSAPAVLDASRLALPLPGPGLAAVLVAAWTAAFLLLGLWIFRRQDLTG